jgi:hypothetical protein
MLQKIAVAGCAREPSALGIRLDFKEVIGHHKVMEALYTVEKSHPKLGAGMRPTFFPGDLREDEVIKWQNFARAARTT